MLSKLHSSFTILATESPASSNEIAQLKVRFPEFPSEFVTLVEQATELELQHKDGQYIRIWGPEGCIDQDEGYEISRQMPGAVPIGDDGGGRVIVYLKGAQGFGLYFAGYGDLDSEDATWVSSTLEELLCEEKGVRSFYWDED